MGWGIALTKIADDKMKIMQNDVQSCAGGGKGGEKAKKDGVRANVGSVARLRRGAREGGCARQRERRWTRRGRTVVSGRGSNREKIYSARWRRNKARGGGAEGGRNMGKRQESPLIALKLVSLKNTPLGLHFCRLPKKRFFGVCENGIIFYEKNNYGYCHFFGFENVWRKC